MTAAPQFHADDQISLFLDFDGTLVHIVERPDLAHVPADLRALLETTHDALDGALALITGRSLASLDELLDPLQLPAAGVHGCEYRDRSGRVQAVAAGTLPDWARAGAAALTASDPGLLMEDKSYGVAIHYRQAPSLESEVRDTMNELAARLGQEFIVQNGKMVVELRPSRASKGTAVSRFMSAPPFAGRQPVFVGDDITDEDAFRVVNALGGCSIRVGRQDTDSVARCELADVNAVRAWLLTLAE